MGIKRVSPDPGTAAAAAYWPFKVISLGGDWVSVSNGEAFYDPMIGGELLDIKGLNLPFRVNSKSFIYLQVFFDLVGRPTHAGIAHTGKNLRWIQPGERWLGYPRMYAVNKLPYFGMWDSGAAGQGEHGQLFHTESGRKANWSQMEEGWFAASRGEGEGGKKAGYKASAWGASSPDFTYEDHERTLNVASPKHADGKYADMQIYTGIDRELRKDICAQGVNTNNKFHNHWPWNLKDVGWYPSANSPGPYTHRRQKQGYLITDPRTGARSNAPGVRGMLEFGGYMNPAMPNYVQQAAQEESYRRTYKKVQRGFLEYTTKLWKTDMDQVMTFYPIAYASLPTKKMANGFMNGVKIGAAEHEDGNGAKHQEREFQIVQACKTNLRLATIIEGDARFKILVPYQGMHSQLLVGDGSTVVNYLNFDQQWDYHAGGFGTSADYPLGDQRFQPGGTRYYRRQVGSDFGGLKQGYLDIMFNNQSPDK
jgi:hypothetical protein